jgi:hypothetical protein
MRIVAANTWELTTAGQLRPNSLEPAKSKGRMFTIVGVVFLVVVQREPTPD